MIILPIHLILEEEKKLLGENLLNLAKLSRSGVPVVPGLVVDIGSELLPLVSGLKEKATRDQLEKIHKQILKIPLPKSLSVELSPRKEFFFASETYLNMELLWQKILESWWKYVLGNISLGKLPLKTLPPQVIHFSTKNILLVKAFFDPEFAEVVIESEARLAPKVLQAIDQMVIKSNNILVFPHVYHFLVGNEVQLFQVAPFTQTIIHPKQTLEIISHKAEKKLVKSAMKIFLNLTGGFALAESVEGVILEGEKVSGFDETVFALTEAALSLPQRSVIFKLPEIRTKDTSGSLALLAQSRVLDQSSAAFIFAKRKKSLFNLELAIPKVRSSEEFLQMKRELAVRGITRKGLLKFWLELSVPENIINIESYLTVGLDGVILNLDQLLAYLVGFSEEEKRFYPQIKVLLEFIKPLFKILHQNKVSILAKGGLALQSDILDLLIESGCSGIIVESSVVAQSLPEHLAWAERRMVNKRLADS